MYALIYDDHDLAKPFKRVISMHTSRATAEKALKKRQDKLGRKVWDCNTRIVWATRKAKAGGTISAADFSTWRPGEKIPEGELHSDTD